MEHRNESTGLERVFCLWVLATSWSEQEILVCGTRCVKGSFEKTPERNSECPQTFLNCLKPSVTETDTEFNAYLEVWTEEFVCLVLVGPV